MESSEATQLYMDEAKKGVYGLRLKEMREEALANPDVFWEAVGRQLRWFKTWDKVLEWNPPFAKWFVGGKLNASYCCLDAHLDASTKNKVAIQWEGEPGERRELTYYELWREVNRFSNVLKRLGVEKGDRITVYMPMVPELPVALLSATRIGAIHSVVFSGFSAEALANRIADSQSKVLVTADGGYRRGRTVPLKQMADRALENSGVKSVVVLKRTGNEVAFKNGRDYWWHELAKDAAPYCPPERVESNHPLYILYTSGTTGMPKGAVHSTGGYLVWLYATMQWVFDIRPSDVYWCTADIGWVTGHSYIVYGPYLHGTTTLMYEGAPDFPAPDRWWQLIERYGVNVLYTTPTAIRMHMKYGEEWAKKHDLSTFRLLGTVGEPINPEAWRWYYRVIGRSKCPIVDTWWQTETGGILITPAPGIELVPLKPGSATYPLPGVHAEVVGEDGRPTKPYQKGYLVILGPWPGMFMTLWGDPQRYQQVYWSRFRPDGDLDFRLQPPAIYYAGDYAMKDEDGYFWLLGRADDVLKVAGHRIGTMELESALVSHPSVAESAVTSKPHSIKGEAIVAFVTLREGVEPSPNLRGELSDWIKKVIGPIATPDELYFVAKLPKTRSGKIMRRLLKAVVGDVQLGDISTLEDEASVDEARQAMTVLKEAMKE